MLAGQVSTLYTIIRPNQEANLALYWQTYLELKVIIIRDFLKLLSEEKLASLWIKPRPIS